ncbi:hypothetical protein ABW19_dt0202084 [Dactylella cylindrospora]|nr:hypothetical protein ABW19_dt0202084 [Dactylella cylindrospora]
MKYFLSLATLAATASAAVVPFTGSTGPFSLLITSESSEYNGTWVAGTIQAVAHSAAEVSTTPDNGFFYEPRTGVLYNHVPIFTGFGDVALALAATFPAQRLPGQHLKTMSFQLEHGDDGKVQADVSMGFDSDGFLTHEGKKDIWYACKDVKGKNGVKYTAIELLIGAQPFDSSCTKVDIQQVEQSLIPMIPLEGEGEETQQ